MIATPAIRDLPISLDEALTLFGGSLDQRLIRREGVPYLWRAYLGQKESKESDVVGAFLHRFVSSDSLKELHCHPWQWSVSFILNGAYREVRASGEFVFGRTSGFDGGLADAATVSIGERKEVVYEPGMRNIILWDTFHRVDLLTPDVWTLFVHGPRVGTWGFIPHDERTEGLSFREVKKRTRERLPPESMR